MLYISNFKCQTNHLHFIYTSSNDRHCVAEIFPIRRKTPNSQLINLKGVGLKEYITYFCPCHVVHTSVSFICKHILQIAFTT